MRRFHKPDCKRILLNAEVGTSIAITESSISCHLDSVTETSPFIGKGFEPIKSPECSLASVYLRRWLFLGICGHMQCIRAYIRVSGMIYNELDFI